MSRPSSVSSFGRTAPSTGSSCFLDLDAARQRLERSESRRSRTHEQLWVLSRLRASTPSMSPAEIGEKDRQIYELHQQLATVEQEVIECKSQLQAAETTILQQKMTIRNQSKAIENPRSGRDGLNAPGRQNYGLSQNDISQHFNGLVSAQVDERYGQQSRDSQAWKPLHGSSPSVQSIPAFDPSVNTWNQAFNSNSTGHTPEPFTSGNPSMYGVNGPGSLQHTFVHGQQGNVSNRNQPLQLVARSGSLNPVATQLKSVQNLQSPLSATSSNPYPESSIPRSLLLSAIANNANASNEIKTQDVLQGLLDMTLDYARKHANFPSTAGDNALPQYLKDKLMEAATPNFAFLLMSNPTTRYLLVSRIMLQWMVKHIFKHDKQDTFSGLDLHADQMIQDFKGYMFQTTAPHLRFTYLNTIANYSKTIRDNSDFPAFVAHLSNERGKILWQRICPMMHRKTENAEDELLKLVQAAHKLAELLHTSTDEFRFDFLDVGTRFDMDAMINIDPTLPEYSAAKLQEQNAAVRLGITPIVSSRENTPQGPVNERYLRKAWVLLKVPR